MSELKTNKISTNDQNNVAIDNALGLKSYTTAQRDALTSVAGDMIYNTTLGNPQVYTGSTWNDLKAGLEGFEVDFLVIAGGGAGAGGGSYGASGGGAGGYRTSYNSETSGGGNSAESPMILQTGTNYTVTVGAGGAASAQNGNESRVGNLVSVYGGSGINTPFDLQIRGHNGGSGGGGSGPNGSGILNQGFDGGSTRGGGGGAGQVGSDGNTSTNNGGDGGDGLASTITGSSVTRAGGGGSGALRSNSGNGGSGGAGGGGNGSRNANATSGTANTGSGGGGRSGTGDVGLGGSGLVVLRWATADATIGATRTGLTDGGVQTDGSDSYIVFTAGTGTITFS
jgi:hypothetical protein